MPDLSLALSRRSRSGSFAAFDFDRDDEDDPGPSYHPRASVMSTTAANPNRTSTISTTSAMQKPSRVLSNVTVDGGRNSTISTDITESDASKNMQKVIHQQEQEKTEESQPGQPDKPEQTSSKEPISENPEHDVQIEDYSVYSVTQKKLIILTASMAGFFSPLSSSIYFPALTTIATDLHVTSSEINLTVTTYMVVQAVAPMMIASFSDNAGRRPAYIVCFIIYIIANLGLALQNSYAALMVLRCLQSAGSSATVVLANGVVGDLITSPERGTYIAFASLGSILGPTLSPIIGGLLSQFLDWHWIFWFLLIFSASFAIPLFLFMPETCRNIVDDGTIPPPTINRSITDIIRHRNRVNTGLTYDHAKQEVLRKNYKLRFPNPLATLVVLGDKETALVLLATGLALGGSFAVSTGASSQFERVYGFNTIQIALMFIPIGAGSLLSAFSTGYLVDWNYGRHAKRNGFPVVRNKAQDLIDFPIERARLEVGLPMFYCGGATIIGYGWMMGHKISLAGPAIILFGLGYFLTAAFQVLNVLMVDIYPGRAATATAASNLVRCGIGAASSALISPMIDALGTGWAYTIIALIFVGFSPSLIIVMRNGMRWRKEKRLRQEKKELEKREK